MAGNAFNGFVMLAIVSCIMATFPDLLDYDEQTAAPPEQIAGVPSATSAPVTGPVAHDSDSDLDAGASVMMVSSEDDDDASDRGNSP